MRIVVVEDESRARRGLRNLLTVIDSEVEIVGEAANGRKGFEMIRALEPDVVFRDIRMPEMDGLEMIEALNTAGIRNIRYVILSAYEEFALAKQAISLGVTEYLVKPVTYEDVEDALSRLHELEASSQAKKPENGAVTEKFENAHPLVKRTLRWIENHYTQKISQEEVALQLNVTPEYLSSLFKKDVGETFPRYVNRYRIEVAKALLLSEGSDRREIPFQVGFTDPKYFGKVFREVTGESVSEYQRRYNHW